MKLGFLILTLVFGFTAMADDGAVKLHEFKATLAKDVKSKRRERRKRLAEASSETMPWFACYYAYPFKSQRDNIRMVIRAKDAKTAVTAIQASLAVQNGGDVVESVFGEDEIKDIKVICQDDTESQRRLEKELNEQLKRQGLD